MPRLPLFLVFMILLSGCTALSLDPAPTPTAPPAPSRLETPYTLDKVSATPLPDQYIDPILALDQQVTEVLFYVNHRQQRFPSGQVRVIFNLYNADTTQDKWVDWKMIYYDSNNDRIEETDWETTQFTHKVIKTIKSNSMRPDVANFTLIVKSSPRTDPEKTKKLGYVREMEEKKAAEEARKQAAAAAAASNAGTAPGLQAVPARAGTAYPGQANSATATINSANNTIGAIDNTIQQVNSAAQAAASFQQTIKAIRLLK